MQPRANTAVITNQELRTLRMQISQGSYKTSDISVVSKNDLERIKRQVLTKDMN